MFLRVRVLNNDPNVPTVPKNHFLAELLPRMAAKHCITMRSRIGDKMYRINSTLDEYPARLHDHEEPVTMQYCPQVHMINRPIASAQSYPTAPTPPSQARLILSTASLHPLSRNKVTMNFCQADITYDSTSYSPDNIRYVFRKGSTGTIVRRTREPAAVTRRSLP